MYTASCHHLPWMFCFEQHPNNSEQFGEAWSKSTQESHLLPRNVMEEHDRVLCLGIWEGKMQVAKEYQASEKEEASDQASKQRKPGVQELLHERSPNVHLIVYSFHNISNTISLSLGHVFKQYLQKHYIWETGTFLSILAEVIK